MKCLILAGGRGERLWPLSRKNYPKQFIQIQKNHSIFQETVARNLPYCDEFIILTSFEYRYIIKNQMDAFQGVTYRCVYEEIPHKTAEAVTLACMDLQPSELIFVVASDHLIDTDIVSDGTSLSYKDAILTGKQYAKHGGIVFFGIETQELNQRFGWIDHEENRVVRFIEKPDEQEIKTVDWSGDYLQNAGLMLVENGVLQRELSRIASEFYKQCCKAYKMRQIKGNSTIYSEKALSEIRPEFIEKILLERTKKLKVVKCRFGWMDVGKLEDLSSADFRGNGLCIEYNVKNTMVINNVTDKVVLMNGVNDLMVVNMPDAVYIGKYGESYKLKQIMSEHPELRPYSDKGTVFYRSWGYYQQLYSEATYRIRRVVLYPGRTIYAHSHQMRSEEWTIVQGEVSITLDGVQQKYHKTANIDVPIGVVHQISNIGLENVVFVETAYGEILHEKDIVSKPTMDLDESQLGMETESFIKLLPAFKDYLWGGTKLREVYGKKCDYDIIAESWELSAHPDGQSIVASGRYKGMPFGAYLELVGKDVLGWKCCSMTDFPLLIKFIDAKGNLSVQVHPDDEYALEKEHQYGKNEMWYIIDCEPGATIYMGFNQDISREEVESRVKNNTIFEVLNKIVTHPGDVFFIPAGTVHAIGAGNLICEIQQSSNCTYRLYDYNRRDKYGNCRELHLQKALDVLDLKKYKAKKFESGKTVKGTVLSRCKYFQTTVYEIAKQLQLEVDESRFLSIVCIKGNGKISCGKQVAKLDKGQSFFVKASKGIIILYGSMTIIVSNI